MKRKHKKIKNEIFEKEIVLIQTNHQLDATVSPVYYPDVYLQLNMFRAYSRPSSGAQQLQ